MQAIEVKYLGATYAKGDRLKAICQARQLTMGISEITDQLIKANIPVTEENRATYIAKQLARKLEWYPSEYYGTMVMGCLFNGNYVFVFTGRGNCNVIK